MAVIERSPAVQALHDHRASLRALASVSQRLSRAFGEQGTRALMSEFEAALAREAGTRRAYSTAVKAAAASADGESRP